MDTTTKNKQQSGYKYNEWLILILILFYARFGDKLLLQDRHTFLVMKP